VNEGTKWRWQFCGIEFLDGQQPVQAWYDQLPEDARDEISDLVRYLERLTDSLWRRPEFDELEGEGGISELRPCDVTIDNFGKIKRITFRIYGFRGPVKGIYTFLHGTKKTRRNDVKGKQIASDRLKQIRDGKAGVHRFKF
jgi:hypothetical protein